PDLPRLRGAHDPRAARAHHPQGRHPWPPRVAPRHHPLTLRALLRPPHRRGHELRRVDDRLLLHARVRVRPLHPHRSHPHDRALRPRRVLLHQRPHRHRPRPVAPPARPAPAPPPRDHGVPRVLRRDAHVRRDPPRPRVVRPHG